MKLIALAALMLTLGSGAWRNTPPPPGNRCDTSIPHITNQVPWCPPAP